jgi:hypothetical protein
VESALGTAIELRVERIDRLFDALDPFPIPSRDLAKGAEDFIVGWARELPADSPLRIVIHLPEAEAEHQDAGAIGQAFARHFSYRANRMSGDLHELFRVGRLSLAIGLVVLAACMLAARLAGEMLGETYFGRVFSEGLIIVGWVANWRPIEIFLYDWWPILQRRRLFLRLAEAPVELKANGPPSRS